MIGVRTLKSLIAEKFEGKSLNRIATDIGIDRDQLEYIIEANIIPQGENLARILAALDMNELNLRLVTGILSFKIIDMLSSRAGDISNLLCEKYSYPDIGHSSLGSPDFSTTVGSLYKMDCVDFLRKIDDCSIDLVFADPPFNLNKFYSSKINDNLAPSEYMRWCESWLVECSRVLKNGGALFVWNLPKWNFVLAKIANNYLTFRSWIAAEIAYSLPIARRLYPGHYSLLYFIKGKKPKTFHPDRLKMKICPKCMQDLKDYGGYKSKMNPRGINLSDVWTDIYPVRHKKYKNRNGVNELPLKLLDRVIEMSSDPGDVVLDPFGGSGTTFIAAELKNRRWIGSEIGHIEDIVERFGKIDEEKVLLEKIRNDYNALFSEEDIRERKRLGLWTCDSF